MHAYVGVGRGAISTPRQQHACGKCAEMTQWNNQKSILAARVAAGRNHASGKIVAIADLTAFLTAVLRPGDRVCLEGDNQKQADVLAGALAEIDPAKIHDLHMIQSGVVLPAHLDVFERGIARRLDYSY